MSYVIDDWLSFYESINTINSEKLEVNDELKSIEVCCNTVSVDGEDEKALSKAELSHINKLLNSKLVETNDLDIEVLRSDPDHPLHSVKNFDELKLLVKLLIKNYICRKESLLKGISVMGFYKPSTIQERALSSLISTRPQNMIAQSQSGTGKTASFLIAMLSRVQAELPYCQCLCMAPTRELALQIVSVARKMAQFMTGISVTAAVRNERASVDTNGYVVDQIVIGTPGTISNWIRDIGPYKLDPSKIMMFVLDEADLMLEEDGFLNISMRVKKRLPKTCQILLFSATYNDAVIEFSHEFVPNPIEFRVKRTELPLENIKQYYLCFNDWSDKYRALAEVYGGFDIGQAIIFCATRKEASWLEGRMNLDGHRIGILSGDLDIRKREEVICRFRSADFRVLVTTNVCSRGLDIPQVNLIINWNMPTTRSGSVDCETYLHRIGRSGRFGKEALAVNFLTSDELPLIKQLESHFEIEIPKLSSGDFKDK